MQKHKTVMLKMKHLILKKVLLKFQHPGQKETIKAQKATRKSMLTRLWQILMVWVWHMKKHMKKEEVEEVELDVSADVDALVKDEDLQKSLKTKQQLSLRRRLKQKSPSIKRS